MELVCGIRGQEKEIKKFTESLLRHQLKTSVDGDYTPDNKVGDYYVQIGITPLQFYSISFPKEYQDIILNTIFKGNSADLFVQEPKKNKTKKLFVNKFFWLIRKLLHLKEIPDDYSKQQKLTAIYNENLQIVGIGLKEDFIRPNGTENL